MHYCINHRNLKKFATKVLKARLNKGWSQATVAKKCKCNQATISRIESGLINPKLEQILLLSRNLDIQLNLNKLANQSDINSLTEQVEILKKQLQIMEDHVKFLELNLSTIKKSTH